MRLSIWSLTLWSIMKYINKKIDSNNIEIVCISDWHAGSRNFDKKMAVKLIEYINYNDNVYVISVGDLTNNALKNSKSDVYTSLSPSEEIDLVCSKELLGSINKDKWLLMTSGNHGNRTLKEVGLSVDELIAERLGVKEVFCPYLTVLNVQLNMNSYFITVHHGAGGGGTIGGKANTLNKLSNIVIGTDIVIMGHTHSPMMIPRLQYMVDKKHNKICEQVTYMINAGTLHNYDDSYAEEKMLQPSQLGQAIITIEGSAKCQPKRIFTRWIV